jgi:AcrR family transcriptional regulator
LNYDQRLEHLLAAAAKVFADKGFHSTTMRDLSRASGMSLAGMYYYVRGKDELLHRVQERIFAQVIAGAQIATADPSLSGEERLRRFIGHHVTFFAAHMAEMKVLSHEADSLTGERRAAINRLKRDYVGLLRGILASVPAQPAPEAETRVAAYALFGMMNWIYTWYDPAGPVDPPRLAAQLTAIALRGVVGHPEAHLDTMRRPNTASPSLGAWDGDEHWRPPAISRSDA